MCVPSFTPSEGKEALLVVFNVWELKLAHFLYKRKKKKTILVAAHTSASSVSSSSTATKRHKYPSESTHGRGALRGSGPRSPACVQTQFTVAPSPLSISQMALIITGGVSVNEPSLGGHLLSLFQFPRGEYAGGGVGTGRFYFFLFCCN